MRLYSHYRSSASYRVRIALNLKGVAAEIIPIDLAAREQKAPDYLALNPQGLVPALDTGAGVLTQSSAILEYLEETCPAPPLLPADPVARAHVRAISALLGADIHPLQNRRVLSHLKHEYGAAQDAVYGWAQHWIAAGLGALETMIGRQSRFACDDAPTMADAFLIPQLYNARFYGLDLTPFARILAVEAECAALPAFIAAHPDNQPGAPKPGAL